MLEISFQYRTLFKLSVLHDFYAEQNTRDLMLVPTPETLKLAKRLGLVIKETNRDYQVLYEPDKLEGFIAEVEKKNIVKFTFILQCNNPYFINYTDIPANDNAGIFYFSNNKVSKDGEDLLLHTGKFAQNSNRYKLKIGLEISGQGKERELTIKDDYNTEITKKKVGPEETVFLDNRALPIGLYNVEEGKSKEAIVLFSQVPVKKPVAVIDISLSGLIKKEFLEAAKVNSLPTYNYKVSFASRMTYWRYLLIGKYNNTLKNTAINSVDKIVTFSGPRECKLLNGQEVIEFISEKPLALKERPNYNFQLKSVKAGVANGKTILEKLPQASVEVIKPESREENSKVFSDIIVYI